MSESKKVVREMSEQFGAAVTKAQYKAWVQFVTSEKGTSETGGPVSTFDREVRELLHRYVYETALANGILVPALHFVLGIPVKAKHALKIHGWLEAAAEIDDSNDARARKHAPVEYSPKHSPEEVEAALTALEEKPAASDEPLICDYCGAQTDNPWHSSGVLNGVTNRHIHSCDACHAANEIHAVDAKVPVPPKSTHEIGVLLLVLGKQMILNGKPVLTVGADIRNAIQQACMQEGLSAERAVEFTNLVLAVPCTVAPSYTDMQSTLAEKEVPMRTPAVPAFPMDKSVSQVQKERRQLRAVALELINALDAYRLSDEDLEGGLTSSPSVLIDLDGNDLLLEISKMPKFKNIKIDDFLSDGTRHAEFVTCVNNMLKQRTGCHVESVRGKCNYSGDWEVQFSRTAAE